MSKKGGKKNKKKLARILKNEMPEVAMKRLIKVYERNCQSAKTNVCSDLRATMKRFLEMNNILEEFVVVPEPQKNPDEPVIMHVAIEPLLTAMTQTRYIYVRSLYVWNVALPQDQIAAVSYIIEKGIYPFRKIELEDCLLEAYSVRQMSLSFVYCNTLTTINLDYNEFGNEGCEGLCTGLSGNRSITTLSICYCKIGTESGKVLGDMISKSSVREVYLDGNELGCDGAMELITYCVDNAEKEANDKALRGTSEAGSDSASQTGNNSQTEKTTTSQGSEKGKKKKKKKGKKSKSPPPPPRIGPWLHKLHLADNSIDIYSDQGLGAPLLCMRLFRKLIRASDCFEELDLEDNLIGDLAGRELVEALLDRTGAGLEKIKLRTTHRMNPATFELLLQLGAGPMPKKKKKKESKDKKK